MKAVIQRIRSDFENLWMAAAVIILYTILVNGIFHAFCPMVIVTGFPCPGCGMTRAVFFFLTGQIAESWHMQPMGIAAVGLFVYFCWNRYIIGRNAKGMKGLLVISFIGLLAVYFVRMYLYFPERIPYVYTEGSLFEKTIPHYQEILHELGVL